MSFLHTNVIVFRAKSEEAEWIKNYLYHYAQASGHLANFHKSCIHFSRNNSSSVASVISQILQVSVQNEPVFLFGFT